MTPKSVTVNDPERHNGIVILQIMSKFLKLDPYCRRQKCTPNDFQQYKIYGHIRRGISKIECNNEKHPIVIGDNLTDFAR